MLGMRASVDATPVLRVISVTARLSQLSLSQLSVRLSALQIAAAGHHHARFFFLAARLDVPAMPC